MSTNLTRTKQNSYRTTSQNQNRSYQISHAKRFSKDAIGEKSVEDNCNNEGNIRVKNSSAKNNQKRVLTTPLMGETTERGAKL
jgi:hypothetical protein